MKTLARARHIQSHMGGDIYFDTHHWCYRVMNSDSPSLHSYHYHNQYIRID